MASEAMSITLLLVSIGLAVAQGPAPGGTTVPVDPLMPSCLEGWVDYSPVAGGEWVPTTVAILLITFGLVLCFLGWRLFESLVAIVGFSLGAFFMHFSLTFLWAQLAVTAEWVYWLTIGLAILGGIGGALCALQLLIAAFFLTGASLGFTLALHLNVALAESVPEYPVWAGYVVLAVFMIVGGIFAIKMGKRFIMLATIVIGSTYVMLGVASLLLTCPMDTFDYLVFVGGTLLFMLAGFFVQFNFHFHHDHKYSRHKEYQNV